MKKQNLFAFMLIFASFFACSNASAQQNVVKLGLGSLVVHQNVNLKYERAFAGRHSIQGSFIYDVPSSPWYLSGLNEILSEKVKKSGFYFVPEYRYYFGKKGALRGFYGGVYGKLGFTKFNVSDIEMTKEKIPTDIYSRVNTLGLGLNIGAQWILGEHFTIDWNIGGLGIARHAIGFGFNSDKPLTYSKEELLAEMRSRVAKVEDDSTRSSLNDLVNTLEPELKDINTDSFDTPKAPGLLLDIRFGLSLGYAF